MKKVEKFCATCKHLQFVYTQKDGDTYCHCPVNGVNGTDIRVMLIWSKTCSKWEGKP